ncbi:glycoside hydrolase family 47 protein [Moniliophthora roreri MCA 2997]|uniref:alpha-1,2-Mannosidase n=1 Tax=Moniliophthora roreri (strain MCA 2997) TaxID=1381753 RepID=V2X0P3_MONRO|nr:glycoside hydrolase family 47 protein [Moniliophthora roreri MCA 2997]
MCAVTPIFRGVISKIQGLRKVIDDFRTEAESQFSMGKYSGTRRTAYISGIALLCLLLYFIPLPWTSEITKGSSEDDDIWKTSIVQEFSSADIPKRQAVVAAFQHAWSAYERDAMGYDEYHPVRRKGTNFSKDGGVGYTIIDAIDTMYLMGLKAEYSRARHWIKTKLSFSRGGNFNTFETTIRVLGGLLSAHYLTSDKLFLDRAIDLADRMLPAFNTPSGLPLPSVNLSASTGLPDQWTPDRISTAEASTLQLEFRYLAELSKNKDYWYKAEKVMEIIYKARTEHNLVPIFMSAENGTFTPSDIRLGSRGDSYYEYLLKQHLQTNRTEPIYRKIYDDAMEGIHSKLVQKTPRRHLTYIAELIPRSSFGDVSQAQWSLQHKQDHLVCFLAGSLMLGAATSEEHDLSEPVQPSSFKPRAKRDWKTGVELLETCMRTHETMTGLSPEIAMFRNKMNETAERDWYIKNWQKGGPITYDARYMLRSVLSYHEGFI